MQESDRLMYEADHDMSFHGERERHMLVTGQRHVVCRTETFECRAETFWVKTLYRHSDEMSRVGDYPIRKRPGRPGRSRQTDKYTRSGCCKGRGVWLFLNLEFSSVELLTWQDHVGSFSGCFWAGGARVTWN